LKPDFAPVRSNLGQQVFSYLRDKIARTEIKPGSKLGVGEIADQLGVSRSPVRDAFHLLIAEGLIEAGAASGYRVIQFDHKQIRDIFVVRRALERAAVESCLAHPNRKRIELLRDAWLRLRNARGDDPKLVEIYLDADHVLHQTLAELSDNNVLKDMLEKIMSKIALMRRWVFNTGIPYSYLIGVADEHLEILNAILTGEADHAVSALDQHLKKGQEYALSRLSPE
jgi:DNA-binding GntR family transcriptional regulator